MVYKCPECQAEKEEVCYDCGCFVDVPKYATYPSPNSILLKPPKGYEKMIHFKEVLDRFQGRERRDIPSEVLNKVREQLPLTTLRQLKLVLRRLKLTKYIPHAPLILYLLTGKELPYIPRATEDKVKMCFRQSVNAFHIIYQNSRKNFISYHFVLYKLLQLYSEDELLSEVPVLKNRLRLIEHERIWKLICEDLNWEYHIFYPK